MILDKLRETWNHYQDEDFSKNSDLKYILLISLGINITEIFIPMYIYLVFQNIIPKASRESLLTATVIVIVSIICGSILKKRREEIISGNKVRNQYLITNDVYRHILRSHKMGEKDVSVSEFNRINRYITGLTEKSNVESLCNFIDAIFGIIFLILLFVICGILFALSVISCIVIFTLIAHRKESVSQVFYNRLNKKLETIEDLRNDFIEEVENNLMRIKLDNLNIRFTNEFESIERKKVKSTEIGVYSDMEFVNKLTALSKLFSITIISIGAILVINNLLASGLLIVGLLLSTKALRPWRNYLIIKNRDSIHQMNLKNYSDINEVSTNGSVILNDCPINLHIQDQTKQTHSHIKVQLETGKIYSMNGADNDSKVRIAYSICNLSQDYKVKINNIPINNYNSDYIRSTIRYIDLSSPCPRASMLEILTNFRKNKIRKAVYWSYISGLDKCIREYHLGYKAQFDNRHGLDEEDTLKIAKILSHIVDEPIIVILDFSLVKYGDSFVEMFYKLIKEISKSMIIITIGGGKAMKAVNTNNIFLGGNEVDLKSKETGGLEP